MAETITHHHPSCPARTDLRADCLGCPTPPAVPPRGSMLGDSFTARWEAARVLNANGWTWEAAMSHLEGSCDRLLCCGWGEDS